MSETFYNTKNYLTPSEMEQPTTKVKIKLSEDEECINDCRNMDAPVCKTENDFLFISVEEMPGNDFSAPSSSFQFQAHPVLDEHPAVNMFSIPNPAQDDLPIPDDKKKRKRKRIRQPELWEKNIRKRKREGGEEYIDAKGKSRPAKVVKPGCESTCKLMCSTNFPSHFREKIKSDFYSLTDAEKNKYYSEYTERKDICRKRTKQEKSRRSNSFYYYFPRENEKIRVCKTFFCSTLAISVRRIYYFHSKLQNADVIEPPIPAKGKFVKKETPPDKVNEVIRHIKSFPTIESHYYRSSNSRQYLDSGLNVSKMYSLYVEQHKDPVKENIYRKIFCEKFNLSFNCPRKYACDLCSEFKAQKNPTGGDIIHLQQHLKREKEGNDERNKDRNLTNNLENNAAVIIFDLENIIVLPKVNLSSFYYSSKLTVYNLTAYCDITKSATNVLWDETRNDGSGDDLASAMIKILKHLVSVLPDRITELVLWSDSCVSQNINSHMSTALIKFLLSDNSRNITSITQKFSEPGHNNVQEVEAVHSLIDKHLKHQEIYSPLSLLRSLRKIKSSTLNLTFLQMQDDDFLTFHKEAVNYNFQQIPYTEVKSITYTKWEWYILKYQTSFLEPFQAVDIRNENFALRQKKIEDIRSMYGYMPLEDQMCMETLLRNAEKF